MRVESMETTQLLIICLVILGTVTFIGMTIMLIILFVGKIKDMIESRW